jgi:hypothetical protein
MHVFFIYMIYAAAANWEFWRAKALQEILFSLRQGDFVALPQRK